jgi:hypothetical protein
MRNPRLARDVFEFLFEMCAARAIRARYLIFGCDLRHYLGLTLFEFTSRKNTLFQI